MAAYYLHNWITGRSKPPTCRLISLSRRFLCLPFELWKAQPEDLTVDVSANKARNKSQCNKGSTAGGED